MKLRSLAAALAVLVLAATSLGAQDHAPAPEQAAPEHAAPEHAPAAKADIITPHIIDGNHLEVPWILPPFFKEVTLPHYDALVVGPFDLNLTKHVVMILLGATLLTLVMILAARSVRRATANGKAPKGPANAVEAMVLYIRNEVILPNVGHHGEGFVPYLLTAFFFILTLNLLGLVPYGSTATGNISVTASMALLTFLTVETAGIRANGMGYLSTIFYWNKEMALPMRIAMFLIMSPVELIGKFTKPFALAIRLFANMTAGHIVVLAFVGMIFTFAAIENPFIRPIAMGLPAVMAVAIMFLELLVAFLQAFIFTLLSAVFIGQMREAHH
jgi:F-type H+-transporting ATPase subunit a